MISAATELSPPKLNTNISVIKHIIKKNTIENILRSFYLKPTKRTPMNTSTHVLTSYVFSMILDSA